MLAPDLPPLPRHEPLHKVQYVVELVGPRSVAAALVRPLLESAWRASAGDPEVFVMGPADAHWRLLAPSDPTGSYDSLALVWDFLGQTGTLSAASARHLLGVAETLAQEMQRRAIALPVPEEVEARVRVLEEIREGLDIGVDAVAVFPGGGARDRDLADLAAGQGLVATAEGFEWRVPGWDEPLLAIDRGLDDPPFGHLPDTRRETVSVGFGLPRCPAPQPVLEAMITLLAEMERTLGASVVIDDRLQSAKVLRTLLPQALAAFEAVGIRPGSAEARRLFPPNV